MKTIGIIGGTSPESTVYYYQYITREYTARFGDHGYPPIIIYSVTFQNYLDWGRGGDWKAIEDDLVEKITALQHAGAQFAIIATNTLHYLYDSVVLRVRIPVLSLVGAVCEHGRTLGVEKLGLLGTKFTMNKEFYKNALANVGIETLVPERKEAQIVQDIIFKELTSGIIKTESKNKLLDIIKGLEDRGAAGVILGCTELPLLIKQEDLEIHVLDTSQIHAEAALKYAMESL